MEQEKVYSDTSLFVGDLAQLSTEVELAECFSQYGELAEVRIMRNNTTRKPLCYGFVTFALPENAKAALEGLNGQPFQGRNLRLGWAAHNFQVRKTEESVVNSLYVRFSTPQIKDLVTEETLHGVFDQFNNVIDVSIKKVVCDETEGTQSGYGFVHFSTNQAGITSAFQALSAVHHTTIQGVEYNVEASKNLLKQFKEAAPRAKAPAPKQKAADFASAHNPDSARRTNEPQEVPGVMRGAVPPGQMAASQMPTQGARDPRGAQPQPAKPRGTYAEAGMVGPGGMLPRTAPAVPVLTTGQLRGSQPYAQQPTGYNSMQPQHPQYMQYAPQGAPYDGAQYGYGPVPGQGPYGHPMPGAPNSAHYHPGVPGQMPVRSAMHLTGHMGMPQHSQQMHGQHGGSMHAPYWGPAPPGAYMQYDQTGGYPHMQNQHPAMGMAQGNYYPDPGSGRESFYISPTSSGSGDAPVFSALLHPTRSARSVTSPPLESGYPPGQSPPGWSPRADAPAYSPPPGQQDTASAPYDPNAAQVKATLVRVPTQYTAHRPAGARDLDMSQIGVSKSSSTDKYSIRTSSTLGRTDSEGGFFSSSSSSLGAQSMPYAVPANGRDTKGSFTMPPTPSTIATNTLPSFSEASTGVSFREAPSGSVKRGQSRSKMSMTSLASAGRSFSMASALSDDEEELVEDEFTYSATPSSQGSNPFNPNEVMPCFSHQSSSTSTFNSSFYNSFPVDTTFLETPNSSTHSMRSQLACRSSEATDASSGGVVQEGREGDTQGVAVVQDEEGEAEPSATAATEAGLIAKLEAAKLESAESGKAAAKSRQLPVTHFFKPASKQAEE